MSLSNTTLCILLYPHSALFFLISTVILNHNNHVTQTKCYADVNVPPANTTVTPLKGSHKVSQLKINSLSESDSTLLRVTAPSTRSQIQSFLLLYLLVFWSSEVPPEFPLNSEAPCSYKTFQVPPANQFQRRKDYMCRLNHNVLISLALSAPLIFLFSQHIFIDTYKILIIQCFLITLNSHSFQIHLLTFVLPKYTMYSFYCPSGRPLKR